MGIFCMVFGIAISLGATAGGVAFANSFVTAESAFFSGGKVVDFLGLPSNPLPYIVVIAFIGFLIGLSIFSKGLILYRLGKISGKK